MGNRFSELLAQTRRADRAALLPFMTSGLPDVESSADMFLAMADAGADGFEIGISYADPLMDGPTIHEAGLRALDGGATTYTSLQLVEAVVAGCGKPAVVMTYVNLILSIGATRFANAVADAGGSGMIVADLPAEEADEILEACAAAGIGLVLFAAPTTDDDRLAQVVAHNPLFVYGVAEMGVTGQRTRSSSHAAALAARVRRATTAPLVLGLGISGPESTRQAAQVADGVIVGSALVRLVLDSADSRTAAAKLSGYVESLAAAVRRA